MKEPVNLASAIHNVTAETVRPWQRRRGVLLCVVAWTIFTGLALWWLLRANAGPSVWIVHEGDSLQPAAVEGFRAWFKADGFQRVYPWVLFGPYAALLALYFPLERGRLRLSLPLNLAACAAFVAAAHALNARTSVTGANVVIVKSQRKFDPATGKINTNEVEFSKTGMEDLLHEQMAKSASMRGPGERFVQGTVARGQSDFSDAGLTNLLVELRQGFKPPVPPPGIPTLGLWPTVLDLLAFGAIIGLAHSVHFYRRFREREHRALFLESSLANARLNALRAQLQPHFLFNSLNAIVTLLRRDPRLAEATLMSLSELLRLTFSQSDKQEVALREEMQFVQRYLEIQQTRFGDRLRVEQDIEPAALDCLVPTLLLQPLVENAIRHGIEPAENAGLVRLTARRQDGLLVLTVEDDGIGLPSAPSDHPQPKKGNLAANSDSLSGLTSLTVPAFNGAGGIGLANLRARLQTLYGAHQKLELVPRSERGVTVLIQIPWRTAGSLEITGAGDDAPHEGTR
jgi:hypothetical protein